MESNVRYLVSIVPVDTNLQSTSIPQVFVVDPSDITRFLGDHLTDSSQVMLRTIEHF